MLAVGFDLKAMPDAMTLTARLGLMGIGFSGMTFLMRPDFLKRVFVPKIKKRMGHRHD